MKNGQNLKSPYNAILPRLSVNQPQQKASIKLIVSQLNASGICAAADLLHVLRKAAGLAGSSVTEHIMS